MRMGLIGSGYWAETVHGPALANSEEVEFIGVWGRNTERTRLLAEQLNVTAYSDVDDLIRDVDALDFAVPPDVQKDIAIRAAAAGKHLVLEKPIALTVADADELVQGIADAEVCAVVFHTALFRSDITEWIAAAQKTVWASGTGEWVADGLTASDSPYRKSGWRQKHGALWDVGPHVLSLFISLLGPVTGVSAVHGLDDIVHLVLTHAGGRTSSSTLSLKGPPGGSVVGLRVWNSETFAVMPESQVGPVDALTSALTALTAQISGDGSATRSDAAFARDIVAVLDTAEKQLQSARGSLPQ